MEKAVECLINRPLKTDWFSLLHTHGLSCVVLLVVTSSVAFFFNSTIAPLFFFHLHDCLCFFLYRIELDFCQHGDLDIIKAEVRFHRLVIRSLTIQPSAWQLLIVACICTACVLDVQKTPLYCSALNYFSLSCCFSCSNALRYLLTFKQPLIHSFFLYTPFCLYALGWNHVSLNHSCSCSSQGPRILFLHICTSRRVPQSVLFTPKHLHTDLQHSKKTHYTINQGQNTPKSYTDKPFSRTHVRYYLCFWSTDSYTVCHFPELHTHTDADSNKHAHTHAHTVNTTNAFSSTNNNKLHKLTYRSGLCKYLSCMLEICRACYVAETKAFMFDSA